MRFYLPRRRRRQLLFPPGLLALAGLLWLGCVALGLWQEKLSRKVVIQLTMPSLKVADTIFSPNPTFWSSTRLNNFRAWRTIKIDGHPEIDVTTTGNRIGQALMTMQADTLHESGLRIRFGPHATYTPDSCHYCYGPVQSEKILAGYHAWTPGILRHHYVPHRKEAGCSTALRHDVLQPC